MTWPIVEQSNVRSHHKLSFTLFCDGVRIQTSFSKFVIVSLTTYPRDSHSDVFLPCILATISDTLTECLTSKIPPQNSYLKSSKENDQIFVSVSMSRRRETS